MHRIALHLHLELPVPGGPGPVLLREVLRQRRALQLHQRVDLPELVGFAGGGAERAWMDVPMEMCEQMRPPPPRPNEKESQRCTGSRCTYTSSCRYRAGRGRSYCEKYFDKGGPCNYINAWTCRS